MADKHTGPKAASAASDTLQDGRTSDTSKESAASALSQADQSTSKHTGESAAEAASDTLTNEDTGSKSKTAAGSTLSQREKE